MSDSLGGSNEMNPYEEDVVGGTADIAQQLKDGTKDTSDTDKVRV